jgi:hypothetical protein
MRAGNLDQHFGRTSRLPPPLLPILKGSGAHTHYDGHLGLGESGLSPRLD